MPRLIAPRLESLFVRFSVSRPGVFVSKLAMLMSLSCVVLGFVVLAACVVMFGLVMMMRGRVVVSGRLMMMLTRWVLRHLNFLFLLELDIPPNRPATESSAGWEKVGALGVERS
jgi:hypothetical protein